MRSALLCSFSVAACVVLVGCGTKSKDGPASPAADPNTVVVDDTGVSLGGERLGDAPGDAQKKIDPLWDKLKTRREEWKVAHPDEPFPGALAIELGPNVTCRAAMGVYVTAVYAGFQNLTVKQGALTVNLPGSVPKLLLDELEPQGSKREAFAAFLADGNVEFKIRRCGGAYDVVPVASLEATVKEWCGADSDCLGAFHMTCDAGVPMAKVLPALDALRKGASRMELGPLGQCRPEDGPHSKPFSLLDPPAPTTPAPPPPKPGSGKPRPHQIREGAVSTSGGLSADEVREALKSKLADLNVCYEAGLTLNPNLQGRMSVRLAIGKKGAVMMADNGGSDMPDSGVVACVIQVLGTAAFPAKGKISTIVYPVMMSP